MNVGLGTAPATATIGDREFQTIRKLVYDNFGINLTEQKRSLVVGRLQKVLRSRGFASYREYLTWLEEDRTGEGLEELANRISTNHTFFYRENAHFQYFQQTVLPGVQRRHARDGGQPRFWCAGCSSGEEPYTLVMLMREFWGQDYDRVRPLMLATDISAHALRAAMAGIYGQDRVAQLPETLRRKYLERIDDGRFRVVDAVRREVIYRRHNLMETTFPFKRPFDAVFCRNVMIYFDKPTRDGLIARFHRHTAPGGHLFIGHSETLGRDGGLYEYVLPAAYRKAGR